jgi:hypothetical protein
MNICGGVDAYIQIFFTSELIESNWTDSVPDHVTPKDIARVTH